MNVLKPSLVDLFTESLYLFSGISANVDSDEYIYLSAKSVEFIKFILLFSGFNSPKWSSYVKMRLYFLSIIIKSFAVRFKLNYIRHWVVIELTNVSNIWTM